MKLKTLSRNLLTSILSLASLFITEQSWCNNGKQSTDKNKPRIVITCDPELDDSNSLVRFLLYSTDVKVEGLIYASSGFHWKGDGKGTKWFVPGREYTRNGMKICPCESWRWAPDERFIHNAVETYEKVYPNLVIHNKEYPSPAELKSKIRYGNIEFDGDISKDSPGSDLIKSLILDSIPGPLFITAWGGQSTIARALKSIADQYSQKPGWESLKKKIIKKVIILPSGDQDDTYAKYIKPNWTGIGYREFKDGPYFGYGAQFMAKPADSIYYTSSWMKENISSRGPLGDFYRVWGDGKQMVKDDKFDYFGLSGYTNEELKNMGYQVWMPVQPKGTWLGEGDTFTFMDMLNNGLRAWEDGSYGGWGGRQSDKPFSWGPAPSDSSRKDTASSGMLVSASSLKSLAGGNKDGWTYPDFLPAAENDLAARFKWSVTPKFKDANHEPIVTIKGQTDITARPGEKVKLEGEVTDPDGNAVTVKWWQFRTGTYPKEVVIPNPGSAKTEILIPDDAVAGQTIHLVLQGTDNGTPALTRYQRVIVVVSD
jgi:hypothetical protein